VLSSLQEVLFALELDGVEQPLVDHVYIYIISPYTVEIISPKNIFNSLDDFSPKSSGFKGSDLARYKIGTR
jgi:hypothetical protein